MVRTWLELARDARHAANGLLTQERFRSCLSRAYYAAYSKVTHELMATRGVTLPSEREGPSHARIRRLIQTSMAHMPANRRFKLSEMIGRLYTLRIDADYKPSVDVDGRDAREAISIMKTVFEAF